MKVVTEESIKQRFYDKSDCYADTDDGLPIQAMSIDAVLDLFKWFQDQIKPHPRVKPKDRLMFEELFAKVEGSSRTQKWKKISEITGFSIQTIRLSLRDSEEDNKETKYFNTKQEMF